MLLVLSVSKESVIISEFKLLSVSGMIMIEEPAVMQACGQRGMEIQKNKETAEDYAADQQNNS